LLPDVPFIAAVHAVNTPHGQDIRCILRGECGILSPQWHVGITCLLLRPLQKGRITGVRETRKLEAVHRILAHDLSAGAKPADGIVCCDNPIDAAMTHDAIVAKGDFYTIPFRAMVPESIVNLLFAGRLVCADPAAFASVRGMPQCMAMGQAAGTAAAMALAGRVPVQALDHSAIVASLATQGMRGIGGDDLRRHAPALQTAA
jgi:hypothetical protein